MREREEEKEEGMGARGRETVEEREEERMGERGRETAEEREEERMGERGRETAEERGGRENDSLSSIFFSIFPFF